MAIKIAYDGITAAGADVALRREAVKTTLGLLITQSEDRSSDVGRRIFEHLAHSHLPTAVMFTQVSKGTYGRSKRVWYTTKVLNQIVLYHIQRGVSYGAYMKERGWKDAIFLGVELTGLATTVAASVKAGIHASRIPSDAPTSNTMVDFGNGPVETTVIDHPEARKASAYTALAVTAGMATVIVVGYGMLNHVENISLAEFFSRPIEDEIIGPEKNTIVKFLLPNYYAWRIIKMKENLSSNPTDWDKDDELSRTLCPISRDLMQYPVVDLCGCILDYRSVRVHQLTAANPMDCPISNKRHALARLRFDKGKFDYIQKLIRDLANP